MTSLRTRLLLLAFPLLLIAGCFSPQPVIRMTPLLDNLFWANGNQVAALQGESARVAVAFLRDVNDQVSFRVEVENMSPAPLLVDPARFYYTMCALPDGNRHPVCGTSRWVVNPEQALLDLDIQRSRQSASNKNEASFFAPFMLLDMMGAVGAAANGKPRAASAALHGAADSAAMIDRAEAREQQQTVTYDSERSMWETGAFRISTIFPRQRAAGMVFIPRDTSTDGVKLHIRVGNEVFAFPFKQTVHKIPR
jgi:hypothetical protein